MHMPQVTFRSAVLTMLSFATASAAVRAGEARADKHAIDAEFRALTWEYEKTKVKPNGGPEQEEKASNLLTVDPSFRLGLNYEMFRTELELQTGDGARNGTLRQFFTLDDGFDLGLFLNVLNLSAPTTDRNNANVEFEIDREITSLRLGPTMRASVELTSDVEFEARADLGYATQRTKVETLNKTTSAIGENKDEASGVYTAIEFSLPVHITKSVAYVPSVGFGYMNMEEETSTAGVAAKAKGRSYRVGYEIVPFGIQAMW